MNGMSDKNLFIIGHQQSVLLGNGTIVGGGHSLDLTGGDAEDTREIVSGKKRVVEGRSGRKRIHNTRNAELFL